MNTSLCYFKDCFIDVFLNILKSQGSKRLSYLNFYQNQVSWFKKKKKGKKEHLSPTASELLYDTLEALLISRRHH